MKEWKHGEQNNNYDNRKCENRQNNFHGNLHSQGMAVIITRMPLSLPRGQERIYLCLLLL
jgi:hypothetical protein